MRTSSHRNARRFVGQYGQDVRYCLERGKWLVWDGKRWRVDLKNNVVMRLAKRTIKGIRIEAGKLNDKRDADALWKFANQSDNESRYNSMLALAESEDGIAVNVADLDAQPLLLNCKNGTVDLATGELREHQRADLLTKICPLDYPAEDSPIPLWDAFLNRIFANEADLIGFMQRLA